MAKAVLKSIRELLRQRQADLLKAERRLPQLVAASDPKNLLEAMAELGFERDSVLFAAVLHGLLRRTNELESTVLLSPELTDTEFIEVAERTFSATPKNEAQIPSQRKGLTQNTDPQKIAILELLLKDVDMKTKEVCRMMDERTDNDPELVPPPMKGKKCRLWIELWEDPQTRASVNSYVSHERKKAKSDVSSCKQRDKS